MSSLRPYDRSFIRVARRSVAASLCGVPTIPDAVHRHFAEGHEELPPDLELLADAAIAAACGELKRRHEANSKRGCELIYVEYQGDDWER